MKMKINIVGVVAALCLASSLAHGQAKIKLINLDGPGVGLNDQTPVPALDGNVGKTLGQQRLIAFQYAADIWGALLRSGPEVRAEAAFVPFGCDKDGTALGGALYSKLVVADLILPDGASDYSYPVAIANAISGRDLNPEGNHIFSSFNSRIDELDCQQIAGVNGWYYGLHGNAGNPDFRSNFLNIVTHELAHGLGFAGLNFGSETRDGPYGAMAWSNDYSKAYNDFEPNSAPLVVALTSPGRTVWRGQKTAATAALLAENKSLLKIVSPKPGLHEYVGALFGSQDRSAINGDIVLVNDGGLPDGRVLHTGCDGVEGKAKIHNREELRGKVALIDIGGCEIGQKVINVQALGAIGAIIANDVPKDALRPRSGGRWRTLITIPVITVTQEVGAALRSDKPVVAAGFVVDKSQFYGLDERGRVKLFTPAQFIFGSSFSHIDLEMSPDALMEPAEGRGMRADVMIGVVLDMMEEMGWPTNRNGTAKLGNCETGIPVYKDGFIPGANLIAHNNMCKTAFAGSRAQQLRCMNDQITWLQGQTLLSSLEVAKARQCVAKL